MHGVHRQQKHGDEGKIRALGELLDQQVHHRQHQNAHQRAHEAPAERRHAEQLDADHHQRLAKRRMRPLIGAVELVVVNLFVSRARVVDLVEVGGVEVGGVRRHHILLIHEQIGVGGGGVRVDGCFLDEGEICAIHPGAVLVKARALRGGFRQGARHRYHRQRLAIFVQEAHLAQPERRERAGRAGGGGVDGDARVARGGGRAAFVKPQPAEDLPLVVERRHRLCPRLAVAGKADIKIRRADATVIGENERAFLPEVERHFLARRRGHPLRLRSLRIAEVDKCRHRVHRRHRRHQKHVEAAQSHLIALFRPGGGALARAGQGIEAAQGPADVQRRPGQEEGV